MNEYEQENNTMENNEDRVIVSSRVYNAPCEKVWEAWTNPKIIAKWWGPNGYTNTIHQMDVRPGGTWKLTMHGPNGENFPNTIVYNEIAPNQKLVYLNGEKEGAAGTFLTTITFEDMGMKTKLTMQAIFPTPEEREKAISHHNALEGQKQTLARLAKEVER